MRVASSTLTLCCTARVKQKCVKITRHILVAPLCMLAHLSEVHCRDIFRFSHLNLFKCTKKKSPKHWNLFFLNEVNHVTTIIIYLVSHGWEPYSRHYHYIHKVVRCSSESRAMQLSIPQSLCVWYLGVIVMQGSAALRRKIVSLCSGMYTTEWADSHAQGCSIALADLL